MKLHLSIVLLALAACARSSSAPGIDGRRDVVQASLDQSFSLAFDQEAVVAGTDLRVRFVALAGDSRCPAKVECVWAGDARIVLRVSGGGLAARDDTLSLTLQPNRTRADGVELRFVELFPAPEAGVARKPDDYRATLVATRTP